MLKLQLGGEIVPSVSDRRPSPLKSDCEAITLLEERKGYGQFRIMLPGRVSLSSRAAQIIEQPGNLTLALEALIRCFVPNDRRSVADTLIQAIETRGGFGFVARVAGPSLQMKTVECLGDLSFDSDAVIGAFGVMRDISHGIERQAVAISRGRLIRQMVENLPVPVVVLDRASCVVGCSAEWARAHGLSGRSAALGKPLVRLTGITSEARVAIEQALKGDVAQYHVWFQVGEMRRRVRKTCVVIPWQCGGDAAGGVILVTGGGEASYADLGTTSRPGGTKGLFDVLETIKA